MNTIQPQRIDAAKLPWLRLVGKTHVQPGSLASLLWCSEIPAVRLDPVRDIRLPQGRIIVDSTGAAVSDAVVSPAYRPIQLTEIAENFLGPVVEKYSALPHSVARSLSGLEVIALSLSRYLLGGHEIAPFILAHHTHGRTALRFSIFEYRLVCSNGAVGLALSASSERILHLRNATKRMEAVAKQWDALMLAYAEYRTEMKLLSETPCNVRETLAKLFPKPYVTRQLPRHTRLVDDLASRSRLTTAGAYGETLLDVYNAVTHRMTHRIENSRAQAQWAESMLQGARAHTTETVRRKLVQLAQNS